MRIDAEYFQQAYADAERALADVTGSPLTDLVQVSDGNHFTISDAFVDKGVPYFRGQDVSGTFFADPARAIAITPEAFDRPYMRRSHLRRGDVLLSIIGTIGSAALVDFDTPATCSCKLAILRPESIESEYLAAFLASSHGQRRIEQLTRGAVQRGLLLEDMNQVKVPRLGKVEHEVSELVRDARRTNDEADATLAQAEAVLLDALGLHDWSPPEPLTYTRSAAAVAAAGRLDANYFAPRYDAVIAKVRATGAAVSLGGCTSLVARGRQPDYADEGLIVVNSKHVRTNRVTTANARRAAPGPILVRSGDLLINGTGVGTIGRVAPYLRAEEAVPDNHVTVVRLTGVDPIYASVFLNSPVGQSQMERLISGSSGQIELYPQDLRTVEIWEAPEPTQRAVAAHVREAFRLEGKSAALLAAAKRAVEIAIEEGEAAALAFIAAQGTNDAAAA